MQEKVTSYADVGRWHSWLSAQELEALAISETVLLSAGYVAARGQMCDSVGGHRRHEARRHPAKRVPASLCLTYGALGPGAQGRVGVHHLAVVRHPW